MNKFALLPFFLLMWFSVQAQDKIISINHDTIHCKIISISNEQILYELKNNDGSVTGLFIPISKVAEYSRSQREKTNISKPSKPNPEKQLCFGLNAGGSTMPWILDNFSSSQTLPDYYDKLKTGYHINANAYYMIRSSWGLGAEYSFFKTSLSGSAQSEYLPSVYLKESEKYRLYINYLGASLLFQQHLDNKEKITLSESISAGVLFIHMENQTNYPNVTQYTYNDSYNNSLLTGKTLSGKFGLAAEYKLFKAISIGIGCDFLLCSLKKASFDSKGPNNYSVSTGNKKLSSAMRLSRIDYSFVLRYYFKSSNN